MSNGIKNDTAARCAPLVPNPNDECAAYVPAMQSVNAAQVIRDAIGSLAYACDALQAPSFSTMRANLADLRALLATMESE